MLKWCVSAVAVLVVGCGGALNETGPDQVPTFLSPPTEQQMAFIKAFPLINHDRKLEAPQAPDGTSPFGALVVVRQPGERGNFCSATHLTGGYVVTNAHCIPDYRALGPGRVFLIFYDKDGNKTYTKTESFTYVGNQSLDDIAVLKIPDAKAEIWDEAGATAYRTNQWAGANAYVPKGDGSGEKELKTFEVTLWTMEPFSHHEDLQKEWQMPGMWFFPKNCVASRRLPEVTGVKAPTVGEPERTQLRSSRSKENLHLFLDQCDEDLRQGNSGSLITGRRKFSRKFGVYHWGIQPLPGQVGKYNWYEYKGNQDTLKYLDGASTQDFFGVGFSLEALARPFPGLKTNAKGANFTWNRPRR